ncbi:MAG: hypothetical protein ACRDSF_13375 [Pseudonocardiaceae bacterium]
MNYQPEFATACASPSADRAVCHGALALALTDPAAATDGAQRERLIGAQREWIGPESQNCGLETGCPAGVSTYPTGPP